MCNRFPAFPPRHLVRGKNAGLGAEELLGRTSVLLSSRLFAVTSPTKGRTHDLGRNRSRGTGSYGHGALCRETLIFRLEEGNVLPYASYATSYIGNKSGCGGTIATLFMA